MNVVHIIKQYISFPAKLIIKNSGIIVIFLLFLIIGYLNPNTFQIKPVLNPEWFFRILPEFLISLTESPIIIISMVIVFVVKSFLIMLVGLDLLMIFSRRRKSLISTLRLVKAQYFFWFLKAELIIYFIFGLIALSTYGVCFLLYTKFGLGNLSVGILVGLFAFLFPIFYFNLSICSTLSVLPLISSNKFSKLRVFYKIKNFLYTYFFYGIRLTIEYGFIFVLPVLAIYLVKSTLLASMFVLIGLVLPLLILRSSAYEFKLNILKDDEDIKEIFKEHFKQKFTNEAPGNSPIISQGT